MCVLACTNSCSATLRASPESETKGRQASNIKKRKSLLLPCCYNKSVGYKNYIMPIFPNNDDGACENKLLCRRHSWETRMNYFLFTLALFFLNNKSNITGTSTVAAVMMSTLLSSAFSLPPGYNWHGTPEYDVSEKCKWATVKCNEKQACQATGAVSPWSPSRQHSTNSDILTFLVAPHKNPSKLY